MRETISFRIVKEPYGWSMRMGDGVMTPFRSRESALRHANGVAEALRRQGDLVEVVLEKTFAEEAGLAQGLRRRSPKDAPRQ
jgi:hypothetical protein